MPPRLWRASTRVCLRKDVDDNDDGARIRRLRKRARLTQAEFAARIGRSQPWVSAVERGETEIDSVSLINRVARVLQVHPNEITGRPYSPHTTDEDRGHAAVTAIRRVVQRYDLPPDWDGPVRPAAELKADVDRLIALRQAARYADLGERAPDLLRELHAATVGALGREAEVLYGLLAASYREADAVAHYLGYDDLSALTTERYRWAAARSGNPHLVAIGDYLRVRELWALDLWADALTVIDTTLATMEPQNSPESLSVWGSLQLRAAITAARACNPMEAWDRIQFAEEAASRIPAGYDPHHLTFGQANVAIHGVATAVELRDGARAVELAASTVLDSTVTRSRRGHHHLDWSRGLIYHGDYDQALVQLEIAERTAPQLVRNHPMTHAAVRALLTHERRSQKERLRRLADRVHVL